MNSLAKVSIPFDEERLDHLTCCRDEAEVFGLDSCIWNQHLGDDTAILDLFKGGSVADSSDHLDLELIEYILLTLGGSFPFGRILGSGSADHQGQ